ncbi:MAG: TonB-dependent receptor [Janthinobacterium lividum]
MSIALTLVPAGAHAGSPSDMATIVVTAPGIDRDASLSLDASSLTRGGTPDLLGALNREAAGLSLSDALGNPWQPELVFRGFVASPLQGGAQGLAVYVDGGRFNQPFGETVNFDLLPEVAIDRVSVDTANPVYGLNALGGAIIVATKTGRSAPGVRMSLAGGDARRGEASIEAGGSSGAFSAYAALTARHDGGWREHSPSTLYNGFGDIGWDGSGGGIHLKLIGADTDLTGNGASPVQLLAADRRAVFTYPDSTRNRYDRVSLHPWLSLSTETRIEASLYYQTLRQRTQNGDTADIAVCPDAPGALCLDDDPLIGSDGRGIAGSESELVIGFSHDRSRTDFAATSVLGTVDASRDVSGIGPVIDQPDGTITPVGLVARTRYTGVFLNERAALLKGLSVELGLRWNEARIGLDDQIGTALDGRHRFDRLNPAIALDYTSGDLRLRAGYAQTNRAPTPAELACADPAAPCSLTNFFVGDPALKQVVARTFEASAAGRGTLGWSLDWRLAAYRTASDDDIQYVAAGVTGRAYFRNIGTTRRQGLDAGVTATQGGWRVHAGYALTDATFQTALILNSPENPAADANGLIMVRPGDRIPGIPRQRGVVSVDYDGRGFTAGADVQAQSGQRLFGDEAGLLAPTAAFAVVNLRASVAVAGPLSLFAELSNVLDTHYATFGTLSPTADVALTEAPGATDPRSLGPGAPRRWLAGVRARF